MPDTLYPPSRPQSVGEILDGAFRIFGATLLRCLPYAAAGKIVAQLPNMYYLFSGRVGALAFAFRDPRWWALYFVGYVLAIFSWSAMLLRQYAIATRHPLPTGAELRTAARRVPGLVLILILVVLATSACVFPIGFIAGGLQALAQVGSPRSTVVVVLVLGALPVSWLMLRWSCAGTAYVLGDRSPVASMAYSWDLTSGNFWRLSLIYGVALVLMLVVYALSGTISGVLTLLFARDDVAVITASATAGIVLLSAVVLPFYSALVLAVLGDLSVRKEGTDLAQRIAATAAP